MKLRELDCKHIKLKKDEEKMDFRRLICVYGTLGTKEDPVSKFIY